MAEIVNLKLMRKRKARSEKDAQAEVNRQKFGQTKAERSKQATEKTLADRKIDGHKRND